MGKRRQEKMAEEIRRVISAIINGDIKDPRIDGKAVSITRVDLTNDYSHARINISVLGDNPKQEETMTALNKAKGYIRTELAKELAVRHAPELEFRLDRSIEHGVRIAALLESLKNQEDKGK
ncbi:MAG: 30S ribosome-binding factor RbfA [Syntrophomonadaceae bacterium]|jgi:ribosome-binding factor A